MGEGYGTWVIGMKAAKRTRTKANLGDEDGSADKDDEPLAKKACVERAK